MAKTLDTVREREREQYSKKIGSISHAKKLNINKARIDFPKVKKRVKLYWENLSFL